MERAGFSSLMEGTYLCIQPYFHCCGVILCLGDGLVWLTNWTNEHHCHIMNSDIESHQVY